MASKTKESRRHKKSKKRTGRKKMSFAEKAAKAVLANRTTLSKGSVGGSAKKSKTKRRDKIKKSRKTRAATLPTGVQKKTVNVPPAPPVATSVFFDDNPGTQKNAVIVPRVKAWNRVTFKCKSLNVSDEQVLEFEINTGEIKLQLQQQQLVSYQQTSRCR
jgi:hypothetical protein